MPPPRRREAALAPPRGAALAQPAGTVLWGQGAARPLQSQAAKRQCPFPGAPSLQQDCAIPSLVPATDSPTLLGTTWDGPKDKQQQGACSRAGRRGPPSAARLLPKPTRTQMFKLWGERRKQQHRACSSQRALGMKWCQGAASSAAGMGWGHPGRCKGTVLAVHSLQLCSGPSEASALPYGQ